MNNSRQSLGRTFSAFSLTAVAGIAATLCIGAATQSAHAQCGPQWLAPLPPVGVDGTIYTVTTWDSDGDGPLSPWLVVGGYIQAADGIEANNVAAWDGVRWHSLNSVYGPTDPWTFGVVDQLMTFDVDGDGPDAAWLLASGRVDRTSQSSLGFYRFIGGSWEPFTSDLIDLYRGSMIKFDPDDEGPLANRIALADLNPSSLKPILVFDGTEWTVVPTTNVPGLPPRERYLAAISAWDCGGPGSESRQIVAAFTPTRFSSTAVELARWDGQSWHVIPSPPFSSTIDSITLGGWDPDGPGARTEQLMFGLNGFAYNSVASFDGTVWTVLCDGARGTGEPVVFQTFDTDGPGPLGERLVITSVSFPGLGTGAGVWDGSTFMPLPLDVEPEHPPVTSLCAWDPDGDGPASPRMVAGMDTKFTSTPYVLQTNGLGIYDGRSWDTIGRGPTGAVSDLVRWTRENGDVLVAAGAFRRVNGMLLEGIGVFDGASWEPLPTLEWPIARLVAWDADGDGPTPRRLVAAEGIEYQAMQVRLLIDDQWIHLGNQMRVGTLVSATLGSNQERLFFIERNEVGPGSVLREWNGNAWDQRGAFAGGDIWHLPGESTLWQRPGSEQPVLVFGGSFTGSDTVLSRLVIGWDGNQFIPIGNGLWSSNGDGFARVVAVDFDASGPQPERLVAIGKFDRAGASDEPFDGIAILDGDVWRPVAVPPEWSDDFLTMTQSVWDPDGAGPIAPTLRIFGFRLLYPGHRATAWEFDGQTVRQLDDGATGVPSSSVQWDPDGPGPIPPRIQVAGSAFSIDEPRRGSLFEAFLDDATPWVATPPRDASAFEGDTITLTASIANGYAELDGGVQFQWRRNGIAIQDGPAGASSNGGTVLGASGTLHLSIPLTLTITNASASDTGDYDLAVTNSCGTLSSAIARVQVSPFCAADFDGSGTIDATDLAAFFTAYETGAPIADVDRNGGIDGADIGAFFAAYQSGC